MPTIQDLIKKIRDDIASLNRRVGAIGGAGEANTGSNLGVGGIGVYAQKVGVELQFRNIIAGSDLIDVVLESTNEIAIDVDPSEIDLGDLGDVDNAAPNDGDVLTWDGGGGHWEPEAPGGGPGGAGGDLSAYRRTQCLYTIGHQFIPYTLTTVAPSRDRLYAGPFIVNGADQSFDLIGIYIITGRANGKVKLAVYDDNGQCYPDSLLYETGDLVATATGEQSEVIVDTGGLILSQGLHWLVFNSEGDSNLTVRAARYSYAIPSVLGFTTFTNVTPSTSWNVAQAFGAMPDPFTGGATITGSVHAPAVMLRKT